MREIDMRKEWLPGVPDSLTVPCGICHHIPRFDYKLKNAGWNMLAPEEHRLGVICLPCLNKIAKEKNVKLADYLEEVFFCDGLGETIDLIPAVAYYYDPKVKMICTGSWDKRCGHGTCGHRWLHDETKACVEQKNCPEIGDVVECIPKTELEVLDHFKG